ncbi:MAG TPA: hypothetical protein V6D48_24865 [Oculatellaceae cyanobacterium]
MFFTMERQAPSLSISPLENRAAKIAWTGSKIPLVMAQKQSFLTMLPIGNLFAKIRPTGASGYPRRVPPIQRTSSPPNTGQNPGGGSRNPHPGKGNQGQKFAALAGWTATFIAALILSKNPPMSLSFATALVAMFGLPQEATASGKTPPVVTSFTCNGSGGTKCTFPWGSSNPLTFTYEDEDSNASHWKLTGFSNKPIKEKHISPPNGRGTIADSGRCNGSGPATTYSIQVSVKDTTGLTSTPRSVEITCQ